MWKKFSNFVVPDNLADWASDLGLLVSVAGFVVTIIIVLRSKKAAEAAKNAAMKVQEDMSRFDLIAELSTAISGIEEIKRLHREGAWHILPDRYSAARNAVVAIIRASPSLAADQEIELQRTKQHLINLEGQVEKALATKGPFPHFPELNRIMSEQTDILNAMRAETKKDMGRSDHGK